MRYRTIQQCTFLTFQNGCIFIFILVPNKLIRSNYWWIKNPVLPVFNNTKSPYSNGSTNSCLESKYSFACRSLDFNLSANNSCVLLIHLINSSTYNSISCTSLSLNISYNPPNAATGNLGANPQITLNGKIPNTRCWKSRSAILIPDKWYIQSLEQLQLTTKQSQ